MTIHVLRLGGKHYRVKTDSDKEYCDVKCANYSWTCSCPDFTDKSIKCEHLDIVEISAGMRELSRPKDGTTSALTSVPITVASDECIYCHSKNVREHSIRHNKSGDVQRYICRDCKRKYTANKQTNEFDIILEAMNLHLTGRKTAEVVESLSAKHPDMKITIEIVGEWISKYKTIIHTYYSNLTRARMNRWNFATGGFDADKVYNRSKKDIAYLYSLLDAETKLWIAQGIWTKHDEYLRTLSPYKAKCLRDFQNNQCTILHV